MSVKYLEEILKYKRKLLDENNAFYDSIKDKLRTTQYTRYRLFKGQISQAGRLNLIAEIKKASPSRGMIREEFDLLAIAKIYVEHKVDAISILAEDKYFLGKPAFIKQVSDQFNVPILAKDFIIDEGQIYEARFNGASAVLLIVSILDDKTLKALMKCASDLDLDCLVEVHDENELNRAIWPLSPWQRV